MESMSRLLPNRRSFASGSVPARVASHKSVYDGVFGGQSKGGIPALAPRYEDYAEIFGGFHASRPSSIPVLHLPAMEDEYELRFADFDYASVFGGFRGVHTAALYEDVVGQSSGSCYSADESWSPAQSELPEEVLDSSYAAEKIHTLSEVEAHQSLDSINKVSISYSKSSSHTTTETLFDGASHVTNFSADPACKHSYNDMSENAEISALHLANATKDCKDFSDRIAEEKECVNCFSNPSCSGYCSPLEKNGDSGHTMCKPFMTISDISLRTNPSKLPPPSRPPPDIISKNGASSPVGIEEQYDYFSRKQNDTKKLMADKNMPSHELHLDNDAQMEDETENIFVLSKSSNVDKITQLHTMGVLGSMLSIEEKSRARQSTSPIPQAQEGKCRSSSVTSSSGAVSYMKAAKAIKDLESNRSDEVEDNRSLKHIKNTSMCSRQKAIDSEASHQECYCARIKESNALMWNEDGNELELIEDEDFCHCDSKQGQIKENGRLSNPEEKLDKIRMPDLNEFRVQQTGEKCRTDNCETFERMEKAKHQEFKAKLKQVESSETIDSKKGIVGTHTRKQKKGNHKEFSRKAECQRRLQEIGELAETIEWVKENMNLEESDKPGKEFNENEHTSKLKETSDQKEHVIADKGAVKNGNCGKRLFTDARMEIKVTEQLSCIPEKDHMEPGKKEKTGMNFRCSLEQDAYILEQTEFREFHMKDSGGDVLLRDENDVGIMKVECPIGNKEDSFERERKKYLCEEVSLHEEMSGKSEEFEKSKQSEVIWNRGDHESDRLNVHAESCKQDEAKAAKFIRKDTKEATSATLSFERNGDLKEHFGNHDLEFEVEIDGHLIDAKLNKHGEKEGQQLQAGQSHGKINFPSNSSCSLEHLKCSINVDNDVRNTCITDDKFASEVEDLKYSSSPVQLLREPVETRNIKEDTSPVGSAGHRKDALCSTKHSSIRITESQVTIMKENLIRRDRQYGHRLGNETVLDDKQMKEIEELEREREREKDRMAVDKEALEGRSRLYAEAHERSERLVGRATAAVKQRTILETRESLEKASVDAKLRAESASVERATAEARKRAFEKSMAEKLSFERQECIEKSNKSSGHSKFSDAQRISLSNLQTPEMPNVFRNSYATTHSGNDSEPTQRCKAQLQRYQQTAERAANALAEKNKRDLLAQREREERNRVAETMDIEVRRWSSGKEGNLRALLSTLQYILGPDGGWQPVPLTEIIASAAVKKAYRKATLCVHPDKLQQRGATIQHKYVCEKVFDLLKEAWNKFNSEEM